MLLEGTAKYFWLLILILILVYITKKIALYFIFKKVAIAPHKALIPVKYRDDLASKIGVDRKKAYMSYIPFYGLKYRKEILDQLLRGFNINNGNSILYFIIPMYKYPELAFKNVNYVQSDNIVTENSLAEKNDPQDIVSDANADFNESIFSENNTQTDIPNNFGDAQNMIPKTNQDVNLDTVFNNQNLNPDEQQKTEGEQICPKCGTKLTPNATVCFMCGQRLV